MNEIIKVLNLDKKFGERYIFKNLCISFPKIGFIALVGDSGCGKSTFLNILSGLDIVFEGEYFFAYKKIKKFNEEERNVFRLKRVGYVCQNSSLLELETALTNVILPLTALSTNVSEDVVQRGKAILRFLGLQHKEKSVVNKMSGGEKQRVAIARALINSPDVVLADEPTGSLDNKNSDEVFNILKNIARDRLVIVVTHDVDLARKYTDKIYKYKNFGFTEENNEGSPIEYKKCLLNLTRVKKVKRKPKVPSSVLFSHCFKVIKERKIRAIISIFSIIVGFIGLGCATYIYSSISNEFSAIFDSIVPPNQVIMSPLNAASNTIGNVYSQSLESTLELEREYPSYIKGVGTSFVYPFEEMFPEANDFYLDSNKGSIYLPSYSVRLLNDILWIEDYYDKEFLPFVKEEYKEDEIVLGMPFAILAGICNAFDIPQDYLALGNYIHQNNVNLLIMLENEALGFDDEEIFTISAVTENPFPCLFHSDHLFAHKFFIEHLQFWSSDKEENENPQNIYELSYLETYGSHSSFLKELRKNSKYSNLVFDSNISNYLLSIGGYEEALKINRIYIFNCDKHNVGFSDINKIKQSLDNIKGYLICSYGGYFGSTSSMMTGFSNKFFLSNNIEKLEEVSDAYSIMDKNSPNQFIEVGEDVIDGNYLSVGSSKLRISSSINSLYSGRLPTSLEEVCLSSNLGKKFNFPLEIYISAEVGQDIIGDYLERDFKIKALKVVGYVNDDFNTLYTIDDWTYDYFVDVLNLSPFLMEPNGAIFSFDDEISCKNALNFLKKNYSNYLFSSPSIDIKESITFLTNYIGEMLFIFSTIALLISLFLLILVVVVTIFENRNENIIFRKIGLSKSDIFRKDFYYIFIYVGIGLIASLAGTAGMIFILKKVLSKYFGTGSSTSIPYMPFLVIVAYAFILLSLFAIVLYIKNRKKIGKN